MRGKAKGGESTESEKAMARLAKALAHDLRLQIMRLSTGRSAPVTPHEAAEQLPVDLSSVAYHFHVLTEVEALVLSDTRSTNGIVQQFYSPNPAVMETPMVKGLLAAPSQASS